MEKKKSMLVNIIVVIALFGLVLGGMASIFYFSKALPKNESEQVSTVILKELGGTITDLPNPDEGTVVIDFRAVDSDVNVDDQPPTRVLLFRSKIVQGLGIYYMYKDQTIMAGTPKHVTEPINLLDGEMHRVVYTFKKGERQLLFVDGRKMMDSEFVAQKAAPGLATGFVVFNPDQEIDTGLVAESVASYDYMLSYDELASQSEEISG